MKSKRISGPLMAVAAATATVVSLSLVALMPNASAANTNQGKFSNVCFYDHMLPDDPIVFPKQAGASHSHEFIGNTTTDADSTLSTLLKGGSNCVDKLDLAAYWAPTLLKDAHMMGGMPMGGTPIHPSSVTTYYLSNGKDKVQPYPQGLKELAGNAKATSVSQAHDISWGCSTSFPDNPVAPKCASNENLHVRVDFADCWNGKDLDSADHVSHVAYSDGKGHCPTGFPVPIPELSILLKYPVSDGTTLLVASGPTYTMHGDFINAWDATELKRLVDKCLVPGVKCDKPK
jgi:hypothetical protein